MSTPPDQAVTHALLAVACMVHDEVERAGLLDDDTPALLLSAVERWCNRDGTEGEVWAATEGPSAPRPDAGTLALASSCAWQVFCYARFQRREPLRELLREQVVRLAERCLVSLGESDRAARARIGACYEAALREARERAARQDSGG